MAVSSRLFKNQLVSEYFTRVFYEKIITQNKIYHEIGLND